jgi:hypothetical protein
MYSMMFLYTSSCVSLWKFGEWGHGLGCLLLEGVLRVHDMGAKARRDHGLWRAIWCEFQIVEEQMKEINV